MYAIIEAGGKQIRVGEGEVLNVEKLNGNAGDKVEFPVLLKVDGESVSTDKGIATAEIISHGKAKKVVVFKYKAKKNERKKQGHRQQFTRVKILSF